MDLLLCNFRKCRKELDGFAWVTSCSHIFCDEDGSNQFSKALTCPACDTSVSGRFDIIRVDLKPSEQYKSMVLAGLKPEIVMEICSRSLSFWTYQTEQEKAYQEYISTKAEKKAVQLEQYYEQIVTRTHSELNTTRRELETAKKRCNELSEKLQEKTRQSQKLQVLYDALRRRYMTSNFGPKGDQPPEKAKPIPNYNLLNLTTAEDSLRERPESNLIRSRGGSPPEREFVFRPNSTPNIERSSSIADIQSLHNRFNIDLRLAER